MNPESLFQMGNLLATAGWLLLLASPWLPALADRAAAVVLPALLSTVYMALVLAWWAQGSGGFGSLEQVATLFESRHLLLAGWLHYLAFDLVVGAWEVRTARAEKIPFLLVLPCLALTFLFGPIGFLVFHVIRILRRRMAAYPLTR